MTDEPYIYFYIQEFLRGNGVVLIINKIIQIAILGAISYTA